MDLGDVRQLKSALLAGRTPTTLGRKPHPQVAGGLTAPQGVALGIAPLKGSEVFALAVRAQSENYEVDDFVKRLGAEISGDIDVRVTGPIRAYSGRVTPAQCDRVRPLKIGYSVGHVGITAGTLGAFVCCNQSGRRGVLSNNHVLANENQAARGDSIVQPGPWTVGTHPVIGLPSWSGSCGCAAGAPTA